MFEEISLSVDSSGSYYFPSKNLRRVVIVIKVQKVVDILSFKKRGFNEQEIVVHLNKDTLVEILNFDDFMNKSDEGTADYKRRTKNKIQNFKK
ncbi:MAG: hypothetical protein IC227_05365 [Enterococcus lacertideformus]|uniref:Uncharacterized protein n=1 Tax=Enterococcus lacertideformus TaxID=2771493 RepID=A0A931AY45_9ENTE|nr:hypothetical protein [Enterococcus lacertideformus]